MYITSAMDRKRGKRFMAVYNNKMQLLKGDKMNNSKEVTKADQTGSQSESSPDVLNNSTEMRTQVTRMTRQLIISALILAVLMYLSTGYRLIGYSLPSIFQSNDIALYVTEMILSLAVIIVNRAYFINGFKSAIHRIPNTDTLISLGALTAFLYSAVISLYNISFYGNMREYVGDTDIFFETSAMILTLVTIGKLIEEKAKGKTSDAINGLADLSPKTAIIETKQGEKEIPIEEVKVGDIFILKPGMSIPVDGIVISGNSAVDESSLTGESIPVDKELGMHVSAATTNMSGFLKCRATEVGDNTAFSHIVQMVKDASSGKVRIAKFSDKVSGILIPVVVGISIITFGCWFASGYGVGFALSRALAVLIISCPCALGLATPVAVMVGSSIGAKHGIIFKSAQSLEQTGLTQIVVVDKTGTVTTGEPKVTDIISTVNDMEHRDLLLTIAYSLESKSEHPLAKAICKYAQKRYITALPTTDFHYSPGKGIRADLVLSGEKHRIYAGTESFIAKALLGINADDDEQMALFESDFSDIIKNLVNTGKTPLIFATKNGILGVIAVADEVKESSREAVRLMHANDIHVVMVTGDRYATAKAVGDEIGISKEEVLPEVLPKDKADIVSKLKQTGKVAMIGDGVNDAPALTSADIGIAIGAGTDVAIDAADVVLIQNNLEDAVSAISLSKATLNIIQQNLFLTFFYNILGIPLAAGCFYKAFGWLLNPVFCALVMSVSSIIVILNALRLFNFKVYDKVSDEIEDTDANIIEEQ